MGPSCKAYHETSVSRSVLDFWRFSRRLSGHPSLFGNIGHSSRMSRAVDARDGQFSSNHSKFDRPAECDSFGTKRMLDGVLREYHWKSAALDFRTSMHFRRLFLAKWNSLGVPRILWRHVWKHAHNRKHDWPIIDARVCLYLDLYDFVEVYARLYRNDISNRVWKMFTIRGKAFEFFSRGRSFLSRIISSHSSDERMHPNVESIVWRRFSVFLDGRKRHLVAHPSSVRKTPWHFFWFKDGLLKGARSNSPGSP